MDVKKLVERVARESGKTTEEVLKAMSERKERTHGLLSDYGALYAIAKEHGIDLDSGNLELTDIGKITPQRSVNVCARAKTVYSPREFKRKDGSKGKFASIILVDKTGEIRLVLWDKNTEITRNIQIGNVILAKNAFSKDNNGIPELHAGSLTNIVLNPDIGISLPEVGESLLKIGGLEADNPSVNILCRANNYYPRQEFQRSDGSVGARASFMAEDETGKIRVVLWDGASEQELKEGDFVNIENAYTKEGINGEVELHVGNRSRIVKTGKRIELSALPKAERQKISGIKPDVRSLNVVCRVLRIYPVRDYSGGKMASLVVGDDTGTIRVVLWDEKSKLADGLKKGDAILLRNAYSRANLTEEPELHVGKYGSLEVDGNLDVPPLEEIERLLTVEKKITDLDPGDDRVLVRAKIVDVDTERPVLYMTCSSCGKRVQDLGNAWMCDACGEVEPNVNLMLSVIIEDDTGNIRAISFRENAEKLLGANLEQVKGMIEETQDERSPLARAKEILVNRDISLEGRVQYNDFSDQLELMVDEIL